MADQNSQFMALLTAVGETRLANAQALGIPWNITHLGVGDANGAEPMPDRLQTTLINERRRAPLNQLVVSPDNAAIIVAEQVIPEDVGGWWIREIGLYDEAGNLVAVANCPPTFKPLLAQGSGRTQVVRLNLLVSSTQSITLKIDPSVVLATRSYVDLTVAAALARLDGKDSVLVATTANLNLNGLQNIDGVAVPAGARVLVKDQASAKDNGIYLAATGAWTRAADADISAEVTPGLIVSVEQGATLANTRWQLVTDGAIVLGTTALVFQNVSAGYIPLSRIQNSAADATAGALMVNGAHGLGGAAISVGGDSAADPVTMAEIAGLPSGFYQAGGYWTGGPLVNPSNAGSLWWNKSPAEGHGTLVWISLSNAQTFVRAHVNGAWGDWVELASTASVQAAVGTGNVSAFAMSTAPVGWLKANGAAVSRTTYAALFAAIGTTFGAGDGATTFNLPDLRGEFLRGWDDGHGVDSGRVMGSLQAHAVEYHNHTLPTGSGALDDASGIWGVKDGSWEEIAGPILNSTPATGEIAITGSSGNQSYAAAVAGNYANETRPRNIALLYCIKY